MKKNLLLISALLSMLFVGCQTDTLVDDGVMADGTTTLTVSTSVTRTYLGEKVGDVYPVYWSENDRIAVNGVQSESAIIDVEDATTAQFAINASVKYPYSITYPYIASTSAAAPKVLFPAEQNYVAGTFASGDAPMCGYVSSDNGKVMLNHLAGVLRLPIKAKSEGK